MENYNEARLRFRIMTQSDMFLIEKWYGMTDQFGYATGFKSFSYLQQKLLLPMEVHRFTLMINLGDTTIGFVFGEIKYIEKKTVLWIHILIIEPAFQHKGFGTCAVNKLLNFIRLRHGPFTCIVAVSNNNKQGLSFWENTGFLRSTGMEKSLHQIGSSQVAILKREINE